MGQSQVLAKPQGDSGDQGNLEGRHASGQQQAEVQIVLPPSGHDASHHHAEHEQDRPAHITRRTP